MVWQHAKSIAVEMYNLTNESPFSKDFRFRDQIRSAAVSISANIAEGDELDTDRQSIRHFYIAKGSTAELITFLIIASEIEYITNEAAETYIRKCEHISRMLNKLIQVRKSNN